MRRVLLSALIAAGLAVAPVARAGDTGSADEGLDLMEMGARLILRHMLRQAEPALDDMRRELGPALAEWGPALRQLSAIVGDFAQYAPPEVLPNGDIIIRRRRPLPGLPVPGPNGEIDL
ncbi:MAG: hypothetical protein N2422_05055 [Rhodobacteraceae bacterium]|nr:hypothetical protein [Paracoccaceae bacterium]